MGFVGERRRCVTSRSPSLEALRLKRSPDSEIFLRLLSLSLYPASLYCSDSVGHYGLQPTTRPRPKQRVPQASVVATRGNRTPSHRWLNTARTTGTAPDSGCPSFANAHLALLTRADASGFKGVVISPKLNPWHVSRTPWAVHRMFLIPVAGFSAASEGACPPQSVWSSQKRLV